MPIWAILLWVNYSCLNSRSDRKLSYPSMSLDKCVIIKYLYVLMQKYNLDVAKQYHDTFFLFYYRYC